MFVLAAALLLLSAGAAASFTSMPQPGAYTSAAPPIPAPTTPRKIDEIGDIRWSDEKLRLDNAAIEIQDYTEGVCYLICYGGKVARAGEARRRCQRAANYLVRERGIAAERVLTIDGGFREERTVEIWPVPRGATPPTAVPTVDPAEVKFIKVGPRRKHGSRRR